jgi:trimethylamine--corrinoid protein Co-methyltransferase
MNNNAEILFKEAGAFEKAYEFEAARECYREIAKHFHSFPVAENASDRLLDMDDLIAEKEIYSRIDENGKRVLTEIGMNIAESEAIIDILTAADAIDFENERALFVPLKRDYVERCLELVPRKMACDPGINAFGTGATPPFLIRPGDDGLRMANRKEFEEVVEVISEMSDVVRIFSLPVATDKRVIPLYFPKDTQAMEGIREVAEKGGPKNADHTLKKVDAFMKWEDRLGFAYIFRPSSPRSYETKKPTG